MQKQLIVQLWVLLKLTDVKSLSYLQRHEADLILTMLSVVLCECVLALWRALIVFHPAVTLLFVANPYI